MIIALVGADGVGKTTASHALAAALRNRGLDAVRLDRFDILDRARCPAAAFVETDVTTLRRHVLAMSNSSRLFFYLWSMSMTLAQAADDEIIVYDSYWMKHVAAEVLYGVEETAALAIADTLPEPDLTVYFELSAERSLERIHDKLVAYECGLDPQRRPESFMAHQNRLRALLDSWATQRGWIRIDAGAPPETLVAQLVDIVRRHQT